MQLGDIKIPKHICIDVHTYRYVVLCVHCIDTDLDNYVYNDIHKYVSYNKSVQITKINHPGRQKMDMDVSPIKYYEYKKKSQRRKARRIDRG